MVAPTEVARVRFQNICAQSRYGMQEFALPIPRSWEWGPDTTLYAVNPLGDGRDIKVGWRKGARDWQRRRPSEEETSRVIKGVLPVRIDQTDGQYRRIRFRAGDRDTTQRFNWATTSQVDTQIGAWIDGSGPANLRIDLRHTSFSVDVAEDILNNNIGVDVDVSREQSENLYELRTVRVRIPNTPLCARFKILVANQPIPFIRWWLFNIFYDPFWRGGDGNYFNGAMNWATNGQLRMDVYPFGGQQWTAEPCVYHPEQKQKSKTWNATDQRWEIVYDDNDGGQFSYHETQMLGLYGSIICGQPSGVFGSAILDNTVACERLEPCSPSIAETWYAFQECYGPLQRIPRMPLGQNTAWTAAFKGRQEQYDACHAEMMGGQFYGFVNTNTWSVRHLDDRQSYVPQPNMGAGGTNRRYSHLCFYQAVSEICCPTELMTARRSLYQWGGFLLFYIERDGTIPRIQGHRNFGLFNSGMTIPTVARGDTFGKPTNFQYVNRLDFNRGAKSSNGVGSTSFTFSSAHGEHPHLPILAGITGDIGMTELSELLSFGILAHYYYAGRGNEAYCKDIRDDQPRVFGRTGALIAALGWLLDTPEYEELSRRFKSSFNQGRSELRAANGGQLRNHIYHGLYKSEGNYPITVPHWVPFQWADVAEVCLSLARLYEDGDWLNNADALTKTVIKLGTYWYNDGSRTQGDVGQALSFVAGGTRRMTIAEFNDSSLTVWGLGTRGTYINGIWQYGYELGLRENDQELIDQCNLHRLTQPEGNAGVDFNGLDFIMRTEGSTDDAVCYGDIRTPRSIINIRGLNLSSIADFNPDNPFTNLVEQCRLACEITSANPDGTPAPGDERLSDPRSDGYPNTLPPGMYARYVFMTHKNLRTGLYRVTWDGGGELGMNFGDAAGTIVSTSGTIEHTVTAIGDNWRFWIRSLPVTNVRVVHVDSANGAGRFDPAFLDRIEDLQINCLRFMDWQRINNNDITLWDIGNTRGVEVGYLRNEEFYTQSSLPYDGDEGAGAVNVGVHPSVIIELYQAMEDRGHFMPYLALPVPHQLGDALVGSSEENIRRMARYYRDNLPDYVTVIVSWSNETWNPGFEVFSFCNDFARSGGLDGSSDTERGAQWYAQQSRIVFNIWQEEWGSKAHRLLMSLEGQNTTGEFWFLRRTREGIEPSTPNPVPVPADLWSITSYVGFNFFTTWTPAQIPGLTDQQIIDTLQDELDNDVYSTTSGIPKFIELSDDRGYDVWGYEGLRHIAAADFSWVGTGAPDRIARYYRSESDEAMTLQILERYAEAGTVGQAVFDSGSQWAYFTGRAFFGLFEFAHDANGLNNEVAYQQVKKHFTGEGGGGGGGGFAIGIRPPPSGGPGYQIGIRPPRRQGPGRDIRPPKTEPPIFVEPIGGTTETIKALLKELYTWRSVRRISP